MTATVVLAFAWLFVLDHAGAVIAKGQDVGDAVAVPQWRNHEDCGSPDTRGKEHPRNVYADLTNVRI